MPVRGYNLTPEQHEYLRSKGNASEYLRKIIERDMLGQSPTLEATVRELVSRYMGQMPAQIPAGDAPKAASADVIDAIKAFMHVDEDT